MSRSDYVVRKFGGEDRARRLYASIGEIGRTEGVLFRFDRIRRTPSSVDAHRLVRFATRYGRADEMVAALFSAHFTDGDDIGDHNVLCAVAQGCGLDAMEVRLVLASDQEVATGSKGATNGAKAATIRKIATNAPIHTASLAFEGGPGGPGGGAAGTPEPGCPG